MPTSPYAFLETIRGVARQTRTSAADQAMRLAVIDPSYTPVTSSYPNAPALPRVRFEGEDEVGLRQYPVMGGYLPMPGDRVWMVPWANTWMVAGPVKNDWVQGHYGNAATGYGYAFGNGNRFDSVSGWDFRHRVKFMGGEAQWQRQNASLAGIAPSGSWTAGATPCGVVIVAPYSGSVQVDWAAEIENGSSGYNLASFELRGGAVLGSGTVYASPSDDITIRVDGGRGTWRMSQFDVVSGLTGGNVYNVVMQFKCFGGTMNVSRRFIKATPIP
jgi:hypothetical protein